MSNTENTPKQSTSLQVYKPANILKKDRSEKETTDVKTSFKIIPNDGGHEYSLTSRAIEEMATQAEASESFAYLLKDGYPANKNFPASVGVAIKVTKNSDVYELHFFDGAIGKSFDVKEINDHHYYKVDSRYLDSLFTVTKFDKIAQLEQEEAARVRRTTLDLG